VSVCSGTTFADQSAVPAGRFACMPAAIVASSAFACATVAAGIQAANRTKVVVVERVGAAGLRVQRHPHVDARFQRIVEPGRNTAITW
jgi:hypothetical protein